MTLAAVALVSAACAPASEPATDAADTTDTSDTSDTTVAPSSASPTPSPTPITDISGCITADDAELFLHEGESTTSVVALMGEGPTGVVVSYEQSGSVCPWLPLAERLVAEGYQVALFDRRTGVPDDYAVDITALLRERGSEQVFLVGGSLGGTASIQAGAAIEPPVAGVVNLSGGRSDSVEAAAELTMPLLQIVASDDNGGALVSLARLIDEAATQTSERELIVVAGRAHASGLFDTEQSEQVLTEIVDFLGAHRGA